MSKLRKNMNILKTWKTLRDVLFKFVCVHVVKSVKKNRWNIFTSIRNIWV